MWTTPYGKGGVSEHSAQSPKDRARGAEDRHRAKGTGDEDTTPRVQEWALAKGTLMLQESGKLAACAWLEFRVLWTFCLGISVNQDCPPPALPLDIGALHIGRVDSR